MIVSVFHISVKFSFLARTAECHVISSGSAHH